MCEREILSVAGRGSRSALSLSLSFSLSLTLSLSHSLTLSLPPSGWQGAAAEALRKRGAEGHNNALPLSLSRSIMLSFSHTRTHSLSLPLPPSLLRSRALSLSLPSSGWQGAAAEALRKRGAEGWHNHRHEAHFTEVRARPS